MTPTTDKKRFRDSAAVVLVRGHGPSLETYLVKRSESVGYMPGFHAFIGGKVDAEDADLALEALPAELPDVPEDLAPVLLACAVREAFEETGVLIGKVAGGPPEPGDRDRILANDVTFAALAQERGWKFDASTFLFAGRWKTPPFAAMRFDTSFFVVRIEGGQEPTIRPGELDSGEWVKPIEVLDRWRHGERTFAAPILWTLIGLAEGEDRLGERLALGPQRSRMPVRRVEMKWGIVLHPMKTRPLPPATHTNAYLIGENEMLLVDPGSDDPEELQQLFNLIDALVSEGRSLKLVLLTHYHEDHVAGAAAIKERYGAQVCAHAETAGHVDVDFTVDGGQFITLTPGLEDWKLHLVHTPGHARGHLSIYHQRTRSLFTGDHIPGGRGTVIISPPEGDMKAYVTSLERLLQVPIDTLFPGHGSPQGGAHKRIRGLIAHRLERESNVVAALDSQPRSLAELVAVVYEDTKPDLWGYAERSLLAHLLKLEQEGRATRSGDDWYAG